MALFTSTELAARIEQADCRLMEDGAAAIAGRRPGLPHFVRHIAGGLAVFTEHGSPFNKLFGIGFHGPLPEDELAEIERAFEDRGADLNVEICTLADPAIARDLSARGYLLVGFEALLGRRIEPHAAPPLPGGVRLSRCAAQDMETWIDVVVSGFHAADTQGIPSHEEFVRDVLEATIRDFASTEGVISYLATRNGTPAGGASMRMDDGIAQLCGSATLPEHRRQGIQAAFLGTRLAEASNAGCELATVTTQPGSKSQQNVQRQGFELLYYRAVLQRPAPVAQD